VSKVANETGVVAVDMTGTVLDAGWTRGIASTAEWIERWSERDTLAMIDAPLVVNNETGPRQCEREVGQRYWRWQVFANSTNQSSRGCGGVALRELLEATGWVYDDGRSGPPVTGHRMSEVYPYTTLVGAQELGYDAERPIYKRKPKKMNVATFRPLRAVNCDEIVRRLAALRTSEVPLDLMSHPETAKLLEPSPENSREYKHREDLIDAILCAWTGLLWIHRPECCQVLGTDDLGSPAATIIAPCRPEQRRARTRLRET
jgi:predicted RNase H-like nuclease